MLEVIVLLIVLLWFFGYVTIPGLVIPQIPLFSINGHLVTLWEILLLLVIASTVGMLPSPFNEFAIILIILWVASTLGFVAIAGLSNLLLVTIVVGLVFYLISGRNRSNP